MFWVTAATRGKYISCHVYVGGNKDERGVSNFSTARETNLLKSLSRISGAEERCIPRIYGVGKERGAKFLPAIFELQSLHFRSAASRR